MYGLPKEPSESIDLTKENPNLAQDYLRHLKQWESSVFSRTQ